MPVMNGWEFRRFQQEDPNLADIPVVVITADGRISAKAEAIGADGYLAKPFELDSLLATVSSFC
jgi:CheY-like chemotaxis protein